MSWTITGSEKNPTDPYRSQVSLLLHGDGTNGSTTITDSSPSPKTVTAVGNAQISTAQSKFGGASIAFDGNGDYLTIPANSQFAFGTEDFTVEVWVYLQTTNTAKTIVSNYVDVSNGWGLQHRGEVATPVIRFAHGNSVLVDRNYNTSQNWLHLAVCRNGSNLRVFFDGIQQGATVTNSTDIAGASTTLRVGTLLPIADQFFNGYIDDLRITKGIARYTANFTPPTAPFPDI